MANVPHDEQNFILAGDFNCVQTELDVVGRGSNMHDNMYQLNTLRIIVDTHNLVDAYRHKHQQDRETTLDQSIYNSAARLNRIYIPATHHIGHVQHLAEILQFTDHKAVVSTTESRTSYQYAKRSPHWKFNNSLLQNDIYLQHMSRLLHTYTEDIDIEDEQQPWDLLKSTIKDHIQSISTHLQREKCKQKNILETAIKLTETNIRRIFSS
jgi:hypothetical protein